MLDVVLKRIRKTKTSVVHRAVIVLVHPESKKRLMLAQSAFKKKSLFNRYIDHNECRSSAGLRKIANQAIEEIYGEEARVIPTGVTFYANKGFVDVTCRVFLLDFVSKGDYIELVPNLDWYQDIPKSLEVLLFPLDVNKADNSV